MAKLHEILAVEGDLSGKSDRIVEEAKLTFSKKADLFFGHERKINMFREDDRQQDAVEVKAMTTTIADKLKYVSKSVAKYWDAVLQKDATNQQAVATIEINGEIIAENLPATFLLGMESKLKTLRQMYEQIPTLQPGIDWRKDDQAGAGVYVSTTPDIKFKTQKEAKHKILVVQDEHHPAQVEKWFEDVPVGRIETIIRSGMISPAEKSVLLGRIDDLLQGVKRARSRANNQDVAKMNVGQKFFDYIHPEWREKTTA